MVYNVAGRTGSNVETATLVRLAEIPNIIGVKEASGNIAQICDVRRNLPPEFLVVSGDDAITLPVMSVGGQGVISVAGNEIPGEMARIVEAVERNDWAAARALHHKYLPLMMINFVESNPIPVKAAMAKMGLLAEVFRLPMVSPSEASRRRIDARARRPGSRARRRRSEEPVVKVPRHSTGDASRLAALLIAHLYPISSLFAPCQAGASPVSVLRATFTTDSWA